MKALVISATTAALLAGATFAVPAHAAPYGYGRLTPHERTVIARSQRSLNALKWRARADGNVNLWERARIRIAEARHHALVRRLRHN